MILWKLRMQEVNWSSSSQRNYHFPSLTSTCVSVHHHQTPTDDPVLESVRVLSSCVWVAEKVADSLCGLAPRFSLSYYLVTSGYTSDRSPMREMSQWSDSDDIKSSGQHLWKARLSKRWKNKLAIRCKSFRTNPLNAEIDISRLVKAWEKCMYVYLLGAGSKSNTSWRKLW